MITQDQLLLIMKTAAGKANINEYLPHLNTYMDKSCINTPLRMSHFLAQVLHESAEFTHMVENLNYSAESLMNTWPNRFKSYDGSPNQKANDLNRDPEKIANFVYGSRMGNGNEESGDGWKYKGRGPIQITGKENYHTCGKDTGLDLINHPELLEKAEEGVISSCWFWIYKGLSNLADKDEIEIITRRINGGINGLDKRTDYYKTAMAVLGG